MQVQRFGGLGAFSTISIRGSIGQPGAGLPRRHPALAGAGPDGQPRRPAARQPRSASRSTAAPCRSASAAAASAASSTWSPSRRRATPQTELSVGYGSFETRKVGRHAHPADRRHRTCSRTSATSAARATSPTSTTTAPTENPSDDTTTTRINNAFNAVDALLKGSHDLGDGLRVDAVQEFFFKDQGVPGPGEYAVRRAVAASACAR